jgi:DNA-binding beta-propeller fold protein YncE
MKTQPLMTPIKVGQLPHVLAQGTDGATMYVANTRGESISIVDLNKMQTTGRVAFQPIPANAAVALTHPVAIANSERGPQFIMSDGTLWRVDPEIPPSTAWPVRPRASTSPCSPALETLTSTIRA